MSKPLLCRLDIHNLGLPLEIVEKEVYDISGPTPKEGEVVTETFHKHKCDRCGKNILKYQFTTTSRRFYA